MRKRTIFIFLVLSSLLFPNNLKAEGKVLINEFLVHPSSGKKEWVELYNPDNIDLSDYFIDDDLDFSKDDGSSKIVKLDTLNTNNDKYPYIELGKIFNDSGDYVVLFDKDGNQVDSYQYTKDPGVDIAIGRSPDITGEFQRLTDATLGQPNSKPLPTLTPTPFPTLKPTHTPKPTPTLKPQLTVKKTSSSTKSTTVEKYSDLVSDEDDAPIKIAKTQNYSSQLDEEDEWASLSGIPTSILGESTESAQKNSSSSPTPKKNQVLVKDINKTKSSSPIAAISTIIGGILLSACSILVFLRTRKKAKEE